MEPENADYLYALAVFYLNQSKIDRARQIAERLQVANPTLPAGWQRLDVIDRTQ